VRVEGRKCPGSPLFKQCKRSVEDDVEGGEGTNLLLKDGLLDVIRNELMRPGDIEEGL
jgi:hypothetical protein